MSIDAGSEELARRTGRLLVEMEWLADDWSQWVADRVDDGEISARGILPGVVIPTRLWLASVNFTLGGESFDEVRRWAAAMEVD